MFKYLGIHLSDLGSYEKHPHSDFHRETLEKARMRVGVVSLLGMHMDGLRPKTAVRLYKSLVRPILEFGAQVVSKSKKQIREMEIVQNNALRRLLGLHRNVKPEIVRLLAGVETLESRFNQLKITYFHKLRTSDSRRPTIPNFSSTSF